LFLFYILFELCRLLICNYLLIAKSYLHEDLKESINHIEKNHKSDNENIKSILITLLAQITNNAKTNDNDYAMVKGILNDLEIRSHYVTKKIDDILERLVVLENSMKRTIAIVQTQD